MEWHGLDWRGRAGPGAARQGAGSEMTLFFCGYVGFFLYSA